MAVEYVHSVVVFIYGFLALIIFVGMKNSGIQPMVVANFTSSIIRPVTSQSKQKQNTLPCLLRVST